MVDVVLDENIYIKAIDAECTSEPTDLLAARIVTVLQARHCWIMSPDVAQAYHRQFSRTRCRGSLPTRLMKSLSEILVDQMRFMWLCDPPTIEGEYHWKDQHVVAAAAAVRGCCLITTDERLAGALERAGILTRYSFRVVDLDVAELLLTQQPAQD